MSGLLSSDLNAAAHLRLKVLRDEIDAIDREVARLLGVRSELAAEIGNLKHTLGDAVYQPEREKAVIANVLAATHGLLPPEAMQRIYERIIDETRRMERARSGD